MINASPSSCRINSIKTTISHTPNKIRLICSGKDVFCIHPLEKTIKNAEQASHNIESPKQRLKEPVVDAWMIPCMNTKILPDSHIPGNPPVPPPRPVNHSSNICVILPDS